MRDSTCPTAETSNPVWSLHADTQKGEAIIDLGVYCPDCTNIGGCGGLSGPSATFETHNVEESLTASSPGHKNKLCTAIGGTSRSAAANACCGPVPDVAAPEPWRPGQTSGAEHALPLQQPQGTAVRRLDSADATTRGAGLPFAAGASLSVPLLHPSLLESSSPQSMSLPTQAALPRAALPSMVTRGIWAAWLSFGILKQLVNPSPRPGAWSPAEAPWWSGAVVYCITTHAGGSILAWVGVLLLPFRHSGRDFSGARPIAAAILLFLARTLWFFGWGKATTSDAPGMALFLTGLGATTWILEGHAPFSPPRNGGSYQFHHWTLAGMIAVISTLFVFPQLTPYEGWAVGPLGASLLHFSPPSAEKDLMAPYALVPLVCVFASGVALGIGSDQMRSRCTIASGCQGDSGFQASLLLTVTSVATSILSLALAYTLPWREILGALASQALGPCVLEAVQIGLLLATCALVLTPTNGLNLVLLCNVCAVETALLVQAGQTGLR